MTRRPDWDGRLADYLAKAAKRTYEPGAHDCLLFPAGAIRAVTGRDLGKGHRGKYRTPAQAEAYLRKLNAGSPEELLDSLLPPRAPAFAMRGDIVLVEIDGKRHPGVCIGADALIIASPEDTGVDGLFRIGRQHWVRAWAVE